jgi:hypothetical protein
MSGGQNRVMCCLAWSVSDLYLVSSRVGSCIPAGHVGSSFFGFRSVFYVGSDFGSRIMVFEPEMSRTVRACAEQIRVPSFVLRLLAKIAG